jgi:hypothetical protein
MKKFEEQIKELIERIQKDIDEGNLNLPTNMVTCLTYLKKQEQKLMVKQNELKFTPQVGMVWFEDYDYTSLVGFMINDYLSTVYNLPASWFFLLRYNLRLSNDDEIIFSLVDGEIDVMNNLRVPYTCAFNEGKMLGLIDENEEIKYPTPDVILDALYLIEELELLSNINSSHAFTLA